MKFSHQLKFNTVPEWRDNYIHYAGLKHIVYAIAKAEAQREQHGTDTDEGHLSGTGHEKVRRRARREPTPTQPCMGCRGAPTHP
eukprot:359300-Chlamydomonas_euryale.AAC.6